MSETTQNKWLQPGFLIVVAILAISAAGLDAAVAYLHLTFLKVPVPLKQELTSLPQKMGHWVQVSVDEPLDKELEEQLATKEYVFRDYVDANLVSAAELQQFEGKTSAERKAMAVALQASRPDAVISLAVTYYTGKADTVAHIPERCYIADGYQYTDTPETVQWNLGPNRLGKTRSDPQTIGVRYLNFEDQTGARRITKRVAYFFFANGKYESDNLQVRQTLQDLRNKHAFYSKIELMAVIPDHDVCASVMTDFLTSSVPEIEKCYPDWNSVEHPAGK
jgi:hypothetical protein